MTRKHLALFALLGAAVIGAGLGLNRHPHEQAEAPALRPAPVASAPAAAAAPMGAIVEQLASLGYQDSKAKSLSAPQPSVPPKPEAKPEPKSQLDPDSLASDDIAVPSPAQYLIRTANVMLEVGDVRASAASVTQAVRAAHGYISNMNDTTSGLGVVQMSMEIRIPAAQLDGVLQQLDGWGKVLSRQVTAQDVSQEYIDTDARRRNLQKTEERLLEHLDKSAALENTIRLESELSRVREQIEVMDGRLRYLNNRIGYCTLQLTLTPTPAAQPIAPEKSFSSAREFTNACREVIAFAQVVWAGAIWLGVWGIVWFPALLVALLLLRKLSRSRLLGESFKLTH